MAHGFGTGDRPWLSNKPQLFGCKCEDLREKVAAVREGGGEAARRRHLARGKSLPSRADAAAAHPGSEAGMLILIEG